MSIFLFSLYSYSAYSQENPLDFYGDVMINAVEPKHKSYAAQQFNKLLTERLSKPNSFKDGMKDIEWVSKLYPSDSTFRIISYQIEAERNSFKAFGYIQKSDGTVITLKDDSQEIGEDAAFMELDQDSWFGALYYNMLEFEHDGNTQYLLFGYNGYSEFDRRKVVDVLVSIEGNEAIFGNEIFVKKSETSRNEMMQRIMISYSADSNVSLNYDDNLEMIVHQNLISRMGAIPGQGVTNVSDGSLVGYVYENQQWVYTPNLFTDVEVPTEAPRPQPVFNDKKDDVGIFGRKEKAKKKRNK
jgi:hypothetical protein